MNNFQRAVAALAGEIEGMELEAPMIIDAHDCAWVSNSDAISDLTFRVGREHDMEPRRFLRPIFEALFGNQNGVPGMTWGTYVTVVGVASAGRMLRGVAGQ
jgi:hypothetical protein